MPAGDPAGYLPNVIKSRRYKSRKLRRGKLKPSTKVGTVTGQKVGVPASGFLPSDAAHQSGQKISSGYQSRRRRRGPKSPRRVY